MTALDVQIVAYGSTDPLRDCLASVASIELGVVVVVDHLGNVANDIGVGLGTSVVVRHDTSNPGFGAGHNRALAEGSSPFVLLLNPDARADAGGVVRALEYLRHHREVGAVQGEIVNVATGASERSQGNELGPLHLVGRALRLRHLLRFPLVRRIAGRSRLLHDHVERVPGAAVSVESLAATALLVRRAAIEEVGGFDDSYFLYGEDLDLCRRLREEGWQLVALPFRTATHVSGGSSATSWARELQWWQGTMQFAARWWSRWSFALGLITSVATATELAVRRPASSAQAFQALVFRPIALRSNPKRKLPAIR